MAKSLNSIWAQYNRLRARFGENNPRVRQAYNIANRYESNIVKSSKYKNAQKNAQNDYDRLNGMYKNLSGYNERKSSYGVYAANATQMSRNSYMGLSTP